MDWTLYFNEAIEHFRDDFNKLDTETKTRIKKKFDKDLFFEPCQIEVLEFSEKGFVVFFLSHDLELQDKIVKVQPHAKSLNDSMFGKKYDYAMLNPIISNSIFGLAATLNEPWIIYTGDSVHTWKEMKPQEFAQYLFKDIQEELKQKQVRTIKDSTSALEKSIAKIPQKGMRDELLSATKRIDEALTEIKRIDDDIGKMRKLVGMTKEVQDWRVLMTDIDRLKTEHVPKEVFESKISELSTRLEALSDIREAYNSILAKQNEFMKQQAAVMQQQSNFITWIKYATVLVPLALLLSPVINAIIIHFL